MTVHYSTLHYRTAHSSTLQHIAVHDSTVQSITAQHITVQYIAVHRSTLHHLGARVELARRLAAPRGGGRAHGGQAGAHLEHDAAAVGRDLPRDAL